MALICSSKTGENMIIHGDQISLRPVRPAEVEEVYAFLSAVERLGDFQDITFTAEPIFKKKYEETGFWKEEFGTLLIVDKQDKILGEISFYKSSTYRTIFEIGFSIFKMTDWGKGFMSEAVNLFVPYLFAIKQVNRIEAATMEGNIGSQRVLEKCGFSCEGTARQALFYRGDYVNLMQYAILREDAGPLSLV
jgi:ribosomal-protein-alanine N-acetyltransferase